MLKDQYRIELNNLQKEFRIGETFRPLAINRVLNN